MYNGREVIDVHGHLSTPTQFDAFAYNLIIGTPNAFGPLNLPDDPFERCQSRMV